MKYCGIIKNDFAAAPGVSVTLFVSGCDLNCPGCHNPESHSFEFGKDYTIDTTNEIIQALQANGIHRKLCIMGGEPLHPFNRKQVMSLIGDIKNTLPWIEIYIWTGYKYEKLQKENDLELNYILSNINYLIDGPYIQEQRDITLFMRGSYNQRILKLKDGKIIKIN